MLYRLDTISSLYLLFLLICLYLSVSESLLGRDLAEGRRNDYRMCLPLTLRSETRSLVRILWLAFGFQDILQRRGFGEV